MHLTRTHICSQPHTRVGHDTPPSIGKHLRAPLKSGRTTRQEKPHTQTHEPQPLRSSIAFPLNLTVKATSLVSPKPHPQCWAVLHLPHLLLEDLLVLLQVILGLPQLLLQLLGTPPWPDSAESAVSKLGSRALWLNPQLTTAGV